MLTTLTIGVLASIASEVITWINKKLTGTVLQGDGAFLLAAGVALVGAALKVYSSGVPLTDVATLWASFTQVWAVSTVFFMAIVQTLGLDVKPTQQSSAPSAEENTL